ncbi:hypothetical protein C2S52_003982 [Perilla frutescens var. hirtella]|nr:hypothetical protein C2S51_011567 [Perilla frutescens var. frutescens]KAH6793505.1 hypothetical protein C2S52_003982 [Perilla frutescens var. hirtella]
MSSSSSKQPAAARKSKGRQKVSMVKMANHSNLQVTFSKRRAGLFKKASELCTLCAADAAIIVFSPANKVYCFGHPNVKTVVDRLAPPPEIDPSPTNPRSHLIIEAHRNSSIRELNIELTRVETLLRAEKARADEIERLRKSGQAQRWLPTSLDDLDFAQLAALKESVMEFKKNLDAKVQKQMFRASQSQNPNPSCFSLGVGENINVSRVPTFDFPNLSLGLGDFSPYFNGAVGYSSNRDDQTGLNDLVGQVTDYPMTNSSSSSGGGGGHDYLRGSYGSSGAMFNVVGGSNGASNSSFVGVDDDTVGSRGVGFALGHGHGLFQMFN